MTSAHDNITIDSSELDRLRSNILQSQIHAYRLLARNLPVSDVLLQSCSYKSQLANLIHKHIQQQSIHPTTIILTNQNSSSLTFSSASDMYRWLVNSNTINDSQSSKFFQRSLIQSNPLYLQQEQDNRTRNRISARIHELERIPANMNVQLRTQALIELKSLKLLQFQKQLRHEVLNTMNKDTLFQTALNPRAYKRPKRHLLREARSTEKYERQRKLEIKQRKQAKRQAFLNAILTHAKDFREYHRRMKTNNQRLNKSIQVYFTNSERELIRERERQERDRIKHLMNEDEEAYRRLVDEKKDARLTLLLSQTDSYIDSLKQLVRQHQQTNQTKKSEESTETVSEQIDNSNSVKTTTTPANEDDEYDAKESYYSIAHRIREPITEQSKMLVGGQLKAYQLQGLEWLVSLYNNNLNGILADEMGLGKTIQTIALIVHLIDNKKNPGPSLIIVPLSTLSNWASEFQRWAPSVIVIQYKGLPHIRKILAQNMRNNQFNVVLTTYEYIMRDRSTLSHIPWNYLIMDEGHRMKNHHCKLTQILNTYYSQGSHRLLLTGTPLQNNLSELWALLNFILPTIFKSSTTFTDWFNAPFATLPSEKVELNHEETLLIIRRLHKVLRPFLLRRLKKEVESQLPDKIECIIKCELSALQRCLYHAMSKNRTLIIENQGKTARRALMNKIMQLRKICNHPFLFQEIEQRLAESFGYSEGVINGPDLFRVSGKFELLDRILPKLKVTGHKVLLFCQMTTVMDLLECYFAYRNYSYLRLDGTTKADDRCELLKDFNNEQNNCFIFLLSTRAGGVGLNLQKADTVILFDSDWNPHQDQQAQDRAHRIGQKNEVRVLRLITVNTIEEKILACAKYKLDVDEKVIQAGMFNRLSTSSERHDYLEQLIEGEDENKDDDDDEDTPSDEMLNQMIARTEEEFNLFNRMDFDRQNYEAIHGVRSHQQPNWTDLVNEKMKDSENQGKENENKIDEMDDDEEDVDFTQVTSRTHRKMKVNRLITDDELPDWLKNDVDQVEKTLENDQDLGKGRRQRKEIDYSDNLTEREFLQALEDENLDEIIEQKRQRKQQIETTTTNLSQQTKRSSLKKRAETIDFNLLAQCRLLLEHLLAYRTEDDRQLAKIFIRLPTQKQLPLYYQIIPEPIDFQRIKRKIDTYRYETLEQFHSDFKLLIKNAQTFNRDTSTIYSDSILLDKIYQDLCQQLEHGKLQPLTDEKLNKNGKEISGKRGRKRKADVLQLDNQQLLTDQKD